MTVKPKPTPPTVDEVLPVFRELLEAAESMDPPGVETMQAARKLLPRLEGREPTKEEAEVIARTEAEEAKWAAYRAAKAAQKT